MSSRLNFLIIFMGQQVLSANSELKFLGRGIRVAGKLEFISMGPRFPDQFARLFSAHFARLCPIVPR